MAVATDAQRGAGMPAQVPAPHPVVDESGGGHLQGPAVHRGHRVVPHGLDLPGGGLAGILGQQHREQHGLEHDEGGDPARVGERGHQGDRAAVRVAHEVDAGPRRRQDGLEQRHLVGERKEPVVRPRRALA
jgi:hypothetical protein